jgi:hypothetical protein
MGILVLVVSVEKSGGRPTKLTTSGMEFGLVGGIASSRVPEATATRARRSSKFGFIGGDVVSPCGAVELGGGAMVNVSCTGHWVGLGARWSPAPDGPGGDSEGGESRSGAAGGIVSSCLGPGGAMIDSPDVTEAVEIVGIRGEVIAIEGVALVWMNEVILGMGSSCSLSDTGSLRRQSSRSNFLAMLYLRTVVFAFLVR